MSAVPMRMPAATMALVTSPASATRCSAPGSSRAPMTSPIANPSHDIDLATNPSR
jgi:hypothetical protein